MYILQCTYIMCDIMFLQNFDSSKFTIFKNFIQTVQHYEFFLLNKKYIEYCIKSSIVFWKEFASKGKITTVIQ